MPPLTYRPYERRTLENLLGAQGLSGGTAYDIFSGVQGTALERLARQQALRMQRRQMATQNQQAFQQGLPGLAQFAVGMSQADVPSGVVGSVFGAYPDRFQGPLQDLLASAYPGDGTLAATDSPFFDDEDAAAIRGAVEQAWARGLRDPAQIETYIMGTLGAEGAAAAPLIRPIIANTISRLSGGMAEPQDGMGSTGRSLLTVGGAGLGGVLGSALGPAGTAGGALIGGYGGHVLGELLDRFL